MKTMTFPASSIVPPQRKPFYRLIGRRWKLMSRPAPQADFPSCRRRPLFGHIFRAALLAASAAQGSDRNLCGGHSSPNLFFGWGSVWREETSPGCSSHPSSHWHWAGSRTGHLWLCRSAIISFSSRGLCVIFSHQLLDLHHLHHN